MSLHNCNGNEAKIRIVDRESRIDARQINSEWIARQRARERQKLLGLLLLVVFVLALAFLRFGKTIPWDAR